MSSEQDPNFDDLTPKSIQKNIGGTVYTIREASAGVGRKYRNATTAAIKMTDAKVSGIGDIAYADVLLAGLCTFPGSGKTPVGPEAVEDWPDAAVQWIVGKVKEMSPSLEVKVTVESIDRQLAKLKAQRAKLVEVPEDGGELGKGSPGSTAPSSD